MNMQPNNSLFIKYEKVSNTTFKLLLTLSGILLSTTAYSQNSDDLWQTKIVPQAYWQSYESSMSRKHAANAGVYLIADYLDSGRLGFGYNYTKLDLTNNAEISEDILYISGQYSLFPDMLPGKLALRLDAYIGDSTLQYNVTNPPSKVGGGSTTIKESTDITAFQPQLAFSNYAKTFYADIGYAYSKYNGISITEVKQITPTLGFGWNDGYDWLQLRAYLIKIDDAASAYSNNQLESLEAKYTYWFKDKTAMNMDFIRLSILVGERALAVDPDAGVIYSSADKQKGSIDGSIQWKLSERSNILTLVGYNHYVNDTLLDDYNSTLFYINLQQKWR